MFSLRIPTQAKPGLTFVALGLASVLSQGGDKPRPYYGPAWQAIAVARRALVVGCSTF